VETVLALLENSGRLPQSKVRNQTVLAHRNIGYPVLCHIHTSTVATLFFFYVSYHGVLGDVRYIMWLVVRCSTKGLQMDDVQS